ncbi:SDR family NAD(P)-dependent oxidoreductase [Marinilongibacter aquaticus]|uniref:SDR family NAD(P)-dependent oxidoreductase n=1 Tax=Marinilongibacter aquaticus TaxID=2975157 RepID=UPI0021BD8FBC|nr:SDR family NAD(P)-dependent oxidoreductase [Marinilongibacter aquaticus]UBM59523.1 SDR family NAD(P)-dependent oxidoreductase [Marinilongibacter aquaticus]
MLETKYYHDLVKSFPRMEGKNVVITGCTSGTGLVLARTCGKLGATVYMLNRPSERATEALQLLLNTDHSKAHLVPCDLQNFDAVHEAARQLNALIEDEGCDVLCNNAGVMGLPDRASSNGYDVQIQTNHLSHFLLTSLLWPALKKAAAKRGEARLINHSSGARRMGNKPILAKYFEANGGHLGGDRFPGLQKWQRYQQSKLANLLFTYALMDHVPKEYEEKIKFLTAHPGPTDSGLQAKTVSAGGKGLFDKYIIRRTLKQAHSVEDGTSGIAICACGENVKTGDFYGPAGNGKSGPAVLLPAERDKESENLLWTLSLKATGIEHFFG